MRDISDFCENVHYYLEDGRVVFTSVFHINRGYCCGNGCRHCPYDPPHERGNKTITEKQKDRSTD